MDVICCYVIRTFANSFIHFSLTKRMLKSAYRMPFDINHGASAGLKSLNDATFDLLEQPRNGMYVWLEFYNSIIRSVVTKMDYFLLKRYIIILFWYSLLSTFLVIRFSEISVLSRPICRSACLITITVSTENIYICLSGNVSMSAVYIKGP